MHRTPGLLARLSFRERQMATSTDLKLEARFCRKTYPKKGRGLPFPESRAGTHSPYRVPISWWTELTCSTQLVFINGTQREYGLNTLSYFRYHHRLPYHYG